MANRTTRKDKLAGSAAGSVAASGLSERARPSSGSGHAAGAPVRKEPIGRHDMMIAALERERDQLRAELERATARIAVLEQQRNQVVDRIDWVVDSLHNLLEDGD